MKMNLILSQYFLSFHNILSREIKKWLSINVYQGFTFKILL